MNNPDPDAWLAMGELERIRLVEVYHKKTDAELPNRRLHSAFHVIVENQVALGDETPVEATLKRLMSEGLDRHDAVHAIGFVLAEQVYEIGTAPNLSEDVNEAYAEKLKYLKADSWLASHGAE